MSEEKSKYTLEQYNEALEKAYEEDKPKLFEGIEKELDKSSMRIIQRIPNFISGGSGAGGSNGGGTVDDFNNVVFLPDWRGSDGATSATDDSNSAHTITFNGSAQIDNSQTLFGWETLYYPGSGDFCELPDSTDWNAEPQVCYEVFIMFETTPTDAVLLGRGRSGNFTWTVDILGEGNLRLNKWDETSGVGLSSVNTTWNPNTMQWYHVAMRRDGDVYRANIDGVLFLELTDSVISSWADEEDPFPLGARSVDGGRNIRGWQAHHRFVKGEDPYDQAENFDIPTAPHPRS